MRRYLSSWLHYLPYVRSLNETVPIKLAPKLPYVRSLNETVPIKLAPKLPYVRSLNETVPIKLAPLSAICEVPE